MFHSVRDFLNLLVFNIAVLKITRTLFLSRLFVLPHYEVKQRMWDSWFWAEFARCARICGPAFHALVEALAMVLNALLGFTFSPFSLVILIIPPKGRVHQPFCTVPQIDVREGKGVPHCWNLGTSRFPDLFRTHRCAPDCPVRLGDHHDGAWPGAGI